MKKTVMTMISAIVLGGLVGCGANTPTNNETLNQDISAGGDTTGVSGETETVDFQNVTQLYGKVKSVIGNEIELSLAKNPFELSEEELEGGIEGSVEIGQAITVTESAMAIPAEGGDMQNDLVLGDQEPLELEYTGETQSFIIPTGVSILNYLTGGKGSIDDIKEGSVISIVMNGEEDEQKIFAIDIME